MQIFAGKDQPPERINEYAFIYARKKLPAYLRTYIHTYMHMPVSVYLYIYICMCSHVRIHLHLQVMHIHKSDERKKQPCTIFNISGGGSLTL